MELMSEETKYNRQLCIDFAMNNNFRIANSDFEKPKEAQVTYRKMGIKITDEVKLHDYEILDHWLIDKRWKTQSKTSTHTN